MQAYQRRSEWRSSFLFIPHFYSKRTCGMISKTTSSLFAFGLLACAVKVQIHNTIKHSGSHSTKYFAHVSIFTRTEWRLSNLSIPHFYSERTCEMISKQSALFSNGCVSLLDYRQVCGEKECFEVLF